MFIIDCRYPTTIFFKTIAKLPKNVKLNSYFTMKSKGFDYLGDSYFNYIEALLEEASRQVHRILIEKSGHYIKADCLQLIGFVIEDGKQVAASKGLSTCGTLYLCPFFFGILLIENYHCG